MARERGLFQIIFKNFMNSLRPRQFNGNLVGTDYFGNKYYEIVPSKKINNSKTSRYFEPSTKDAFDQEMPAEWEAWLRYRRTEPPSQEELMKNLALMQSKKKNAAALDAALDASPERRAKALDVPQEKRGAESFPSYEEYEIMPGKKKGSKD